MLQSLVSTIPQPYYIVLEFASLTLEKGAYIVVQCLWLCSGETSGSTLALVRQNIVGALYLYAAAGLENGLEWWNGPWNWLWNLHLS